MESVAAGGKSFSHIPVETQNLTLETVEHVMCLMGIRLQYSDLRF